MNISITEDDFIKLVSGEVIKKKDPINKTDINIALQDIGFPRMKQILSDIHFNKTFNL